MIRGKTCLIRNTVMPPLSLASYMPVTVKEPCAVINFLFAAGARWAHNCLWKLIPGT